MSTIVEGSVFEHCGMADPINWKAAKVMTRVKLGPDFIAARLLNEKRLKMSPQELKEDLGIIEKHYWAPLTIQEGGQIKTVLVNIHSTATRLGFSLKEVKEASQKGELETLVNSKVSSHNKTEKALLAAPFKDVQADARRIATFIESHKQEWFDHRSTTSTDQLIVSWPRNFLVTKNAIVMLPRNKDPIIGEGSFKTVRKGLDVTAAKTVAVAKGIVPKTEELGLLFARREASTSKSLAGRVGIVNTIATYETIEADEVHVTLVEEFADLDLHDAIFEGKLHWHEREQIALDLLEGLAEMHRKGLIHRDIKPGNSLVLKDSERGQKRGGLTDFGSCCNVNDREETSTIRGTTAFLPPELLRALYSKQYVSYGTSVDIYSMGLVFGMLFTGENLPWLRGGLTESEIYTKAQAGWKPKVPVALQPLVYKMLHPLPECRPTAQQALEQMRIALGRGETK